MGEKDELLFCFGKGWDEGCDEGICGGLEGMSGEEESMEGGGSAKCELVILKDDRLHTDISWLQALQRITNRRRSNLPSSTLSALAARDQSELLDLHDLSSRQLRAATRQDKLSGRTSGTKDWRIARQEAGKATEREEEPVPVDTSHSTSLFSLTSDSDRIALTGSAEKSSFGISLTRCTTSQTGWAAIKLPLSLPRPNTLLFDLTFRMRKSDPNSDGADGMALVLMKGDRMNHVKGKSGFGLGYDGLGEKGDFAIELDTYQR